MNRSFPRLPVFWNMVFSPAELSMQIFPKAVKEIIASRLRTEVKATYEFEELRTRTVENLIDYLNGENGLSFDAFFDYVQRHDKFRP